uniref:sulfite exporter TauE/SafE family protein n=1 Tax=Halomonas sp. TaxID=1486246 RepID=UPI00345B4BEE
MAHIIGWGLRVYSVLLLCGGMAGVTTVLFGFGGGFVVVPLMYAMLVMSNGVDSVVGQSAMHIAVATSTAVMIFAALLSTWRHQRAGTLSWHQVKPLIGYIAIGAVGGAAAAQAVSGSWVRWAFVVYLVVTIMDSILRPGFMQTETSLMRPMGRSFTAVAGTAIGVIAAFLGVGGSVMTVPLMRRRGASMTAATAMANPLSLPMAITATATYVLLARHDVSLGPWHAGYVDLRAFMMLALGSWLGIQLASTWIGRIPDHAHAKIYVLLLVLVLLVMLVIG